MDAAGPARENQYTEIHSSTARSPPNQYPTMPVWKREGVRTLVVRVRIRVGPGDELLIDPREEADGRVRERVAERLWLRRLLHGVPLALGLEPSRTRNPGALGGGVGREQVLQPESRELRERGRGWDPG